MPLFDPAPPADPADPDEQRALVALSLVPGVGPARVRALLARFGSAAAALRAPARQLARVEGVGPQTAAAVAAAGGSGGGEVVARLFREAQRVGATLVTLPEPGYPALLRRIYDPPPCLWVLGALAPEDARAVAVVGTRRATDYGRRVAEWFGGGLAERGVTVVSGLAYGVDAAAHRAALDAGGRTVAVLGSGVDRLYPARHAPLVRRLVDGGQGAVVTEFPPGTPPDAVNFPRRNRVVAGLSLGVLVAEARAGGGALLTAMMALEQDREVFAAPAPLFSEMEGANRLVRRGWATLVTSVDDVLAELPPGAAPPPGPAPPPPAPARLHPVARRLLDALGAAPTSLDALCAAAGVEPSAALVHLLTLEFAGLVRQLAGKQFYRA